MLTLESFLMLKHLPMMEVSQELPLTPFQIGVYSFFLPTSPVPMLSSALPTKPPSPAHLSSAWSAVSAWGQCGEEMEVPLSWA